jgi:ATP-dependent Zn protease
MPELTAYHEAGHAFMALYVGARVRQVTVEPDWDDGPARHGDTQIEWHGDVPNRRQQCENEILVALAGPVAEMIQSGEPYHPGFVAEWAADWQAAWQAAESLVADEPKRVKLLERMTVGLYRLLERDDHWAALAAIVDNLLAHETLAGEEVQQIVAEWLQ